MKNLFLLILLLAGINSFAQQSGEIRLFVDEEVTRLLNRHLANNKEIGELAGYRIQLISSPNLQGVKDEKTVFMNVFGEKIPVLIVNEPPNFKLRAGNYLNRFDANRELEEIKSAYPNAFIVKDVIDLREHEK